MQNLNYKKGIFNIFLTKIGKWEEKSWHKNVIWKTGKRENGMKIEKKILATQKFPLEMCTFREK